MLCQVILLFCYGSVFNDRWMFLFVVLYSFSTDKIQQNNAKNKIKLNITLQQPSFKS